MTFLGSNYPECSFIFHFNEQKNTNESGNNQIIKGIRLQMYYKIGVLINFAKFVWKQVVGVSLLTKLSTEKFISIYRKTVVPHCSFQ